MVCIQDITHDRPNLCMFVGIRSLVPPGTRRELAIADEVDTATALCS